MLSAVLIVSEADRSVINFVDSSFMEKICGSLSSMKTTKLNPPQIFYVYGIDSAHAHNRRYRAHMYAHVFLVSTHTECRCI